MLRFNLQNAFFALSNKRISIHPMLRFNIIGGDNSNISRNFNTSYVTVQLKQSIILSSKDKFQYILCYGSTATKICFQKIFHTISIHPMLRFNPRQKANPEKKKIISIHPMLRFNMRRLVKYSLRINNFNTSYVTVQLYYACKLSITLNYFNTSYVTVQLNSVKAFSRWFLTYFYPSDFFLLSLIEIRLTEHFFKKFLSSAHK